jgi:hypothetical protein
MMDIQRWTHDGIYMTTQPDGRYVEYADHIADRAELVRLLKEARQYPRHAGCFIEKLRLNRGIDYRCDWCKQVDALEGMK